MLRYSLFVLIFALSACQSSNTIAEKVAWEYKDFNERDYRGIDTNDIPPSLIKTIKKNYAKNPGHEGYAKIGLIDAYQDTNKQKIIF